MPSQQQFDARCTTADSAQYSLQVVGNARRYLDARTTNGTAPCRILSPEGQSFAIAALSDRS